jgi:carboxypeptidase family protein/TonB-dependent receptor-like protein
MGSMAGRFRWLACAAVLAALGGQAVHAQQPAAPAPAGAVGTVSGVVLDKVSRDPIIEAGVEVVGTGKTVRTDLDGKFSVKLPAGTYELRIFAPLYQGTRLEKVTVRASEVTKADATLASAGKTAVEVVEVIAQAKKAAETTQLLKRQKAATVSDNVSAETIAKSPDSSAGEVVKRAPAVTVKGDRFVFIRGLNERYSSAALEGSRLPSPDPDRRVVPLDLFPSDFIDSLSIVKSYTPDLPGDFSGGLIDINLREFPDQLKFGIGTSVGANTSTTAKRFRTYKGSDWDYFGYGTSFRDLPDDFPEDNIGRPSTVEQRRLAGMLRNIWSPKSATAPPNTGFNLSFGDTFGPLGFEVAGVYSTEYQTVRNEVVRQFFPSGGTVNEVPDDFRTDTSTFKTTLGGILTSAFQPDPNHRLTFRALLDRNTKDEVREGTGVANSTQPFITTATGLRYTDEELDFGQLGGEHHFGFVDVDWRTAYARTTQDVPDGRITAYLGNPASFQGLSNGNSGLRYFLSLEERLTDSAIDFTIPFKTALPFTDVWSGLPAKFKFGPAYAYRHREFDLRKFEYTVRSPLDPTKPPETLLDPANIGHGLSFEELNNPADRYSVSQEIIGGYGMFDLPLIANRLRVVAGVREEYSLISLDTVDQTFNPIVIRKKNVDPLPAANLIYTPRSDMNVRFSYFQSVTRPEFRELSPAIYPSVRFDRGQTGNPNLIEANIESYDLRWEWFFTPTELVSLGGFYKKIDQPIEATVFPNGSELVDTYTQADNAELEGFEVEMRKNFGFIRPSLTYLGLTTNVAYIESNVLIPRQRFSLATNTERQLQGQSPFVVNAVLDWTQPDWGTARLLYNTAGARLDRVGTNGLPDIFEERRDQLDFVVIGPLKRFGMPGFTAKLAVENILNDPIRFTQGPALQNRYVTGTKFSIGLSYSY